jgi:hypothetical protein
MGRWIVAFLLGGLGAGALAAERVPIRFDIPAGLEAYSGVQPVTFGVPFERGLLKRGAGLRVVDAKGKPLPAQFEVTATWAPGSDDVRWLLVDLPARIRGGKAESVYLEFGPPPLNPPQLWGEGGRGGAP